MFKTHVSTTCISIHSCYAQKPVQHYTPDVFFLLSARAIYGARKIRLARETTIITNDQLRNLLGLPARLGGIGVPNPAMMTDFEFAASLQITEPLKRLILAQEPTYTYEAMAEQMSAISEIRKKRRKNASQMAEELSQSLPPNLQRAIDLAKEKGASSWLTTLPIKEFGFCLHKGAFSDALALRYGLPLSRLPSHCACGRSFTVEHALSCSRGGFPIIRHNEVYT